MKSFFNYAVILTILASCGGTNNQTVEATDTTEQHRPQIHFTPKTAWMNDPNGMVFLNGTYHLFYQHYPDSTVWGPMHWGYATSNDLVHWQHRPIALYPDSLGYIFSGSCVVDSANTSGFGKDGKEPLIAIFTHHDMRGEKGGVDTFQYQSIAYSLDEGKSWTKYAGNPVLRNPGIRDFRDPKVMWHAESKKWIMTLATKDRVTFYSSPDFKRWTKESEFGQTIGAHGGVWECPDLFPLEADGKKHWVLLVSINPGGPNGGSATQYFVGDFDGRNFKPYQSDTRWIDYGPDNYAGVTWSNTGERKIFLGWMSNWQYATVVPTKTWRSAMTVPRDLSLQKVGERWLLASTPSPELKALEGETQTAENISAKSFDVTGKWGNITGPIRLDLTANQIESFTITLSNSKGQKLLVGFDKSANQYFIDRTASGKTAFEKGFAKKHVAPKLSAKESLDLTLMIDDASVELFADGGLTVMTQVFFPDENFSAVSINADTDFIIQSLRFARFKSIYQQKALAQD